VTKRKKDGSTVFINNLEFSKVNKRLKTLRKRQKEETKMQDKYINSIFQSLSCYPSIP